MADIVYNPNDVFVAKKASNGSFMEYVLSSSPDTLVSFDSASNLVTVPKIGNASVSASWASSSISSSYSDFTAIAVTSISASYSLNSTSTSYANTASYALNAGSGGTIIESGSFYPITSSWSENAIFSNQSLLSSYSSTSISSSYAYTSSLSNTSSCAYHSSSLTLDTISTNGVVNLGYNAATINIGTGVSGETINFGVGGGNDTINIFTRGIGVNRFNLGAVTSSNSFINISGSIKYSGSFIPAINNSFNLGSTSNAFSTIYTTALTSSNAYINYNLQAGSLVVTSSKVGVGDSILNIAGLSGSLFSVDGNLSGSLFNVTKQSGLPVFEAFSDDAVNIGRYGIEAIKVLSGGTDVILGSGSVVFVSSSGVVGINTLSPQATLHVAGNVSASNFLGNIIAKSSSWASQSLSASYVVGNTFSRVGSFVNPGSTSNIFVPIWNVPYNATLTSINATYIGGTGATFNARKNFSLNVLSSSANANSGSWATFTALAQASFAAGDTLELKLITGSIGLSVVSIQCNFSK